G
ncbi:hypothetical protein BN1723_019709, partial [Verticillium longisporum]